MNIRRAIFSGSWYPGDESSCRQEILDFVKNSVSVTSQKIKRVGGIVPHAGWYFSGQIACNVINCLKGRQDPDVIVIFGMHLPPSGPNFIMNQGYWETPIGKIEIDEELSNHLIKRFPFQVENPESARQDNTIELQLPFIKYFFPDVKIVPIGVAPTSQAMDIGRSVVKLANKLGLHIKVLGSTDLTHYGMNYGFTPQGKGRDAVNWVKYENDRRIVEQMMEMDSEMVMKEGLSHQNACCPGAAAAAIEAGKNLGAEKAESLVYATSYDKSPGESFVGYVGIVF